MLEAMPRRVWLFWEDSGETLATDASVSFVVPNVLRSWQMHNPDWEVTVLNFATLPQFMDTSKLKDTMSIEAKTDMIRINVLDRHGGVWSDASAACLKPLDSWIWPFVNETGYFMFGDICSWFVASAPHSELTSKWVAAADAYWANRTEPSGDVGGVGDYRWLDGNLITTLDADAAFARRFYGRQSLACTGPCSPHMFYQDGRDCADQVMTPLSSCTQGCLDSDDLPPIAKLTLYAQCGGLGAISASDTGTNGYHVLARALGPGVLPKATGVPDSPRGSPDRPLHQPMAQHTCTANSSCQQNPLYDMMPACGGARARVANLPLPEYESTWWNIADCDAVLAEYEAVESVEGALRELRCRNVFVYSKSSSCAKITASSSNAMEYATHLGIRVVCEDLPNMGREQHTFLHHATKYHGRFSSTTYFVPLPLDTRDRLEWLQSLRHETSASVSSFACASPSSGEPAPSGSAPRVRVATTYAPALAATPTFGESRRIPAALGAFPTPLASSREYAALPEGDSHGMGLTNLFFADAFRLGGAGCNGESPVPSYPDPICLDFYLSTYEQDYNQAVHQTQTPVDVRPLWAWVQKHMGVPSESLANVPLCYNGIARTSRENLESRPAAAYAHLRDQLYNISSPEAGHYLERLMAATYGPPVNHWQPRYVVGPRQAQPGVPVTGFIICALVIVALAVFGVLRCCLVRNARASSGEHEPLRADQRRYDKK